MSRSKNKKRPGYARLLDSWTPPEGAGEAVGCLATSFTFQSDFFEEECLSRFVGMESDPEEDGAVYLIEREEKLAALRCAAVLVDQHNCRGTRSLRWDLLPARVPGVILHAKISLLYWINLLRVIVSSANITKQGFGLNREIFGVLDLGPGIAGPRQSVLEMLGFLRGLVTKYTESAGKNPGSLRCRALIEEAEGSAKKWDIREYNGRRSATKVYPLLVSPGRKDVFTSLKGLWPDSSPPRWAFVTSPFFDPPESENLPAKAIWKLLSQRGEAEVTYNVLVEMGDTPDVLCVKAPESLRKAEPSGRNSVNTIFAEVPQTEAPQDNKGDKSTNSRKSILRPLHMKSIWLENERSALYMMGSSNFTSAGLGLSRTPNVEANLVYVVNKERNKGAVRCLDESYLYGEDFDEEKYEIRWESAYSEGEDTPGTQDEALPEAFDQAVYYNDGEKACVDLSFVREPPPGWLLMLDDSEEAFFDETQWKAMGAPMKNVCLVWTRPQPPSGFYVTWEGSTGKAWWPVVASGPESLPPPEKLKGLTLEDLIGILSSSRSLHKSMRRLLKKKEQEGPEVNPVLDPHKRVDTSSFVLQRTRRFSWALSGIRTRLEGTLPTQEALKWRLYGPVGVLAFGEAIIREAKNDDERAFLLSELALELSRVRTNEMDKGLNAEVVKKEIRNVIMDLRKRVLTDTEISPQMKTYVKEAFLEALR